MARTTMAVTTLQRLARPQRDRVERQRRGQPAAPGRRQRRLGHRARTPGRRRRLDHARASSTPTSRARSRPPTTRPSSCSPAPITEEFPDAVPTPYVMMAATDARHFTAICPRVYRFTPFRMTKAQRESIHSYDEHIGVEDFLAGVRWYTRILEALVMSVTEDDRAASSLPGLGTIVGFLVCVEIASGILQGYYTPIFSDIARHLDIHDADVNWFEAAQLVVSALVVPVLARLGDLDRPPQRAAAVHRRHRGRVVGRRVRADLRDLPGGVGDPGLLRRVAAARGLDHPSTHGRHRRADAADPPGGVVPRGRPRARRDPRRGDERCAGRLDADDAAAHHPGDRGHSGPVRRLVRRRAGTAGLRLGPARRARVRCSSRSPSAW